MALSIKHPEADRLARALADETGEGLTEAVTTALRERLDRIRRTKRAGLAERLLEIGRRLSAAPVLDAREPDEILGYDERGLPN
ncbi:MAG: type II toxin-antitoxin system VapB family antitoxin [Vulcanimicrobiaceae bacterium]